ncbi:hypothetical protein [Streptomyces sp. NPDC051572]|uniref:hypothetical protein n=1 Tax=Streptomyces sp. NPDC051572 TaxID=3155802 RepID=UPI00344B8A98
MNVDDVVAAKIAAAARRAEEGKRRRAAFAAARKRGLVLRHAAKLRHLNSVRETDGINDLGSQENPTTEENQ